MPITPYVALDLQQLEKNVRGMTGRLTQQGIEHWPHIKTHKSVELAKFEIECGAKGITCATLQEATVMAQGGINHILLAYPMIGEQKCQQFVALAKQVNLRTIVDSLQGAKQLSTAAVNENQIIEIYIAVDYGAHREGIQLDDLEQFALNVQELPNLKIIGVFTYAGTIYQYRTEPEIRKAAKAEADLLLSCQQRLANIGIKVQRTSGGSTLSSFYADELKGITESRAGNFIFGDMNAIYGGIYTPIDCALTIRTTVVSIPIAGYATVDAGTKTLTSDQSAGSGFGYIVEEPNIKLVKLNEEHGYLRYDPEKIKLNIGDVLNIIPNHSCVIPNLTNKIYALNNNEIDHIIIPDARY
ncbi:alanine racemase [Providencia rettgeri]|uniref:alanine racemase n=1 Tax=Providencia TaxID=586 RepID=UPI001F03AAD2|nr:alanine racemase [Providencia rettgeri]EJD6499159.1 alanine racemase [Providencia rettgeri]EJD6642291.1 alanine racemase [Providencia rettgeri]ELL9152670.1 alanine racemase [Providencia rettgeri]ELR5046707.1 alanine racemase [Providencia rettgeri]ELR5060335.1 alanine racemase [Providencia rettgeri]